MARRRSDSGYALLLVFLMAAMIAISLYMEMPRVAFQAERQREQLLMERGEQYKRAIGLFLRTNKNTRWPATIEELENFNNHRSLRKRYIDPITGKDDWRLIHIQNGVLTDSVTNKKPNAAQQDGLKPTGFITELQGVGQQGGAQNTVNPGLRRRPSDGGPALGPDGQPVLTAGGSSGGIPGAPPIPDSGQPNGASGNASSNSVLPAIPGFPTTGVNGGAPGFMGIPGAAIPIAPGANGQGMSGQNTFGLGGQSASGQTNSQSSGSGGLMGGGIGLMGGGGLTGGGSTPQPTVPGAPPQGFPTNGGGAAGFNGPPAQGVPGFGQPGSVQSGSVQPGGMPGSLAQSAAAGLLQNLLTQPRPGGLQGVTSAQGSQGAIMGAGIAGVASKAAGETIMIYADRTDFAEWEFIYDPMKFRAPPNPNSSGASGIGVPAASLGSNAGLSAPGTAIGTGPGGTQASGLGGAQMGPPPGGNTAGFSSLPGGFLPGASPAGGTLGSTLSGTLSNLLGSANGANANGAAQPAGGGSTAFGIAGGPDIRPGKK